MATWDFSELKHHILICNGASCLRNQGDEVTNAIRAELNRRGLDEVIHTTRTRCNGRCHDACVTIVYPEGIWYKDIKPGDAKALVQSIASGAALDKKISHSYQHHQFVRNKENNIIKGVKKYR
ncbi:(2Fe-2S) ferredoxin domain-containing protein [Fictibacillus gelatini]|uniref:(2Fe-2S) ferredoxin domain-containing protein n=1 Tax=Fictibacillus gelatini TaxID=225985 RepID=UPI000422024E|nr:(2Fe-2S) ferredoxin domain-containing protein [Fictibacillus gelatini]